ncbi:MAG TPA: hypothetical protein VLS89_16680, partial [Candidatus Nanopelagicales bacterium]|nr:hypothetical protein [Candidatus Nanopelagicales bacterium]
MSRRPVWQTIFERFDPEHPVEVPAWRAERPLSPFEDITQSLDEPFGTLRVLLTGTVGTGKSTELLRIAEARAGKEFVVFLDLERHFEQVVGDVAALQQVSAWEVCFVAGIALLRAAEDRLGFVFPEIHLRELEQAWLKLARSSEAVTQEAPAIDVGKLARVMVLMASKAAPAVIGGPAGAAVGAGLESISAARNADRWALPLGLKKKTLPDQDAEVQTLLRCVNVLIGLVQQRAGKVLLVLDGLDRLESFERARELFISSQMIQQLACHLVVCGPLVLEQDGALNPIRAFSRILPLVNLPVLSHEDPRLPGPGLSFFQELFARRVEDLRAPDLVSTTFLNRLAYYSGGRAREFVVFINRLAQLAWRADVSSATAEMIDKVLDERRRLRETGLHRGHIRVLEAVLNDPDYRLPQDELVRKLL